jgi:hypothetical protein
MNKKRPITNHKPKTEEWYALVYEGGEVVEFRSSLTGTTFSAIYQYESDAEAARQVRLQAIRWRLEINLKSVSVVYDDGKLARKNNKKGRA